MISSEYYPPGSRSSSRASSRARSGLRSQVFFHTRCIWGSTVGEFKLHLWCTNFCLPYGKVSCQQPWSPPWGRQIGGNMDKQEKTILVLVFPSLGFVLLMLFSHKKSLCSRYKSGLLHFTRRKCSLVGGQVEGGSGEATWGGATEFLPCFRLHRGIRKGYWGKVFFEVFLGL